MAHDRKTQDSKPQDSKPQASRSQDQSPDRDGFTPFADDAAVRSVGALAFENGTDRIALHGSLDITRDRRGLAQARALKRTLDAVVTALEGADLPEAVAEAPDEAPRTVRNPFA